MDPRSTKNVFAAYDEAKESVTLSDATHPEMPLVYANRGFELMTGYKVEDVIGRNCRFLQGHLRSQEAARSIRGAIHDRSSCLVELVNFRKDGSQFVNRLSIRPIFNRRGKLVYFVGLQNDVTLLKQFEEKILMKAAEME